MLGDWQTLPVNGQVPTSAVLAVRFKEPVASLSVTSKICKLTQGKKKVPLLDGVPRLSEDGLTLFVQPASTLASGSSFRLTLKGGRKGVRTTRGGTMSDRKISIAFETSLEAVESLGVAE
jgi:hypothetical protein